jgi:hypothetical protein
VSKGRHPKPAVANALDAVKNFDHLTVVENHKGHRWGWVICLECHQGPADRGHPGDPGSFTVWGTPEPPENHAKQIARFVARHRHWEEAL